MKQRNLFVLVLLVLAAVAVVVSLPLIAGDQDERRQERADREAPVPVTDQAPSEPAADSDSAELTRVEPVKVCMINDALFPNDQIPVEVDGKTYYGCCPMCKERLEQDAGSRTAVDPVTGEAVDKATAVIAARPDGSVLYFESEETFEEYREKASGGADGGGR